MWPANGCYRNIADFSLPAKSQSQKNLSVDTPGTGATAVITALVEGRGIAKGEIGMASLDLKRPELMLCQFSDTRTYSQVMIKLKVLQPIEILMPSTLCDGRNMTMLFKMVSDMVKTANIVTIHRKYFNERAGFQYMKDLCLEEYNAVQMESSTKYYCLASAAALIKYVEYVQDALYVSGSLKVTFLGSDHSTMIDVSTAHNLELLANARSSTSTQSLFGVLNHTKTPGGARLLRSNLLQPSCDMETIHLRQECVQELTEKEDMFYKIEGVLKRFLDVDFLLSLCVKVHRNDNSKSTESKITKVIHLKHTLELVLPLLSTLQQSESQLLVAFRTTLQDERFGEMLERTSTVLHDDTQYEKCSLNMKTQKCFAVRSGMNGLLDVARKTYTDIVDDIAALAAYLGSKYDILIRVCGNNSRGFYFQLYSGAGGLEGSSSVIADELPKEFIKISKNRHVVNFSTPDLVKLNGNCRMLIMVNHLD